MSTQKTCCGCGVVKPLDDFHRNRTKPDGRQNLCKPCNIERNKRWYREYPDARGRRMDGYAKRRRLARHQLILEYLLDHPCVDCGETDPVVLEFDHLRDKRANVSALLGARLASLLAEIEKCDVVCANCHRRRTAARGGYYRFLNAGEPRDADP